MQFSTPTSGLLVRPARRRRTTLQRIVARLFGTPGLTTAAIGTALGVALFVDLVLLSIDAAAIWSIAGYLHLPASAAIIFAIVLTAPALWLCWYVAKLSLLAERDVVGD